MAVKREQDVSLLTQLTHKAFGLAPLERAIDRAQVSITGLYSSVKHLPAPLVLPRMSRVLPQLCDRQVLYTTHVTVQFDVLGKGSVDLCERAAESATRDVNQILQRVHVIVLHKVLAIMELREDGRFKYSGAKKYLVSHQLFKFSHLKR